jgi:DNA polymerase III sliding clamp (beta) subunit (PCNA family)
MDIEREELKKAVGLVFPGIARKETFDQADKIAFKQGRLISYNDEVSIFHPLMGVEEINGAVDGRKLYDILNKVTGGTVILRQLENELQFKCARTTVNFNLAPVVLPFTEVDWTGEYQKLPEDFKKALRLITGTCARDMSRPVLTCVYVNENVMLGSDGYRVGKFVFEDVSLPTFLLPVTAGEMLDKYDIQSVAVGDQGEWARFMTSAETVVCTRLSTGVYPDLSNVLDVTGDEVTLPKTLIETLDRAQIFAKREHSIDEEVHIDLRGVQIAVNSNYENGRFEEIIRAAQEATGKFTIHPEFLSEALSGEDETTCVLDRSRIKFVGANWEHVIALR